MKTSEIQQGGFYTDGKYGVRQVVETKVDGEAGYLRYKTLSMKNRYYFDSATNLYHDETGSISTMTVKGFAAWAHEALDPAAALDRVAEINVQRIKLSPLEQKLLQNIREEFDTPPAENTEVSFDNSEKRAIQGLVKKGLCNMDEGLHGGTVTFSAMGAAWFRVATNMVEGKKVEQKKAKY